MFIDGKEIKAIRHPVKYRVIQTLLISAVDGAILKSFDVVRAMILWFDIMYHKPWLGQTTSLKHAMKFGQILK